MEISSSLLQKPGRGERKYQKALRNHLRKSWKDFTNEVKHCNPIAKLKKDLAKDPHQPEVLLKNDGISDSENERLRRLHQYGA